MFPAVPSVWTEASFERLRADGAFLVSAVRRNGRTAWVKIESLAGEPCRLVVSDWERAVVRSHTGPAPRVAQQDPGDIHIDLAKGASVILAPDAAAPLPDVAPVPPSTPGRRYWPALPSQARDKP